MSNYKPMTADDCYRSYKAYEMKIEHDVRRGVMDKSIARRLLESAKRNYRNQSYNRQIEKLNES